MRNTVEHRQEPWIFNVITPKIDRITACLKRAFIHGTFDGKTVGTSAKAAPRAGEHRQADHIKADLPGREIVGRQCSAGGTIITDKVGKALQPWWQHGVGEDDVTRGQAMPPGRQPAIFDPCRHAMAGLRAVKALGEFLGAGPLHLDRPACAF